MKQIITYIFEHSKNSKFSILERLHINKNIGKQNHHYNYHPKTRNELKELVDKLIKERGNEADLNDIDTSEITDMTTLLCESSFNGDISNWDVSNVKYMNYVFCGSEFTGENGDISNWDVSNVEDMCYMFCGASFTAKNGDLSNWDVSNVQYMDYMFNRSSLEKNPPKWYKII